MPLAGILLPRIRGEPSSIQLLQESSRALRDPWGHRSRPLASDQSPPGSAPCHQTTTYPRGNPTTQANSGQSSLGIHKPARTQRTSHRATSFSAHLGEAEAIAPECPDPKEVPVAKPRGPKGRRCSTIVACPSSHLDPVEVVVGPCPHRRDRDGVNTSDSASSTTPSTSSATPSATPTRLPPDPIAANHRFVQHPSADVAVKLLPSDQTPSGPTGTKAGRAAEFLPTPSCL